MIALLCIFHCIIIAKHSLICSDPIQSDHTKRYASPSMPAVISCCHSNLSSVCRTYRYTVLIQHPGYIRRYFQTSDMSYPRKPKCPSCKDIQKVILIFLLIILYKLYSYLRLRYNLQPYPYLLPPPEHWHLQKCSTFMAINPTYISFFSYKRTRIYFDH